MCGNAARAHTEGDQTLTRHGAVAGLGGLHAQASDRLLALLQNHFLAFLRADLLVTVEKAAQAVVLGQTACEVAHDFQNHQHAALHIEDTRAVKDAVFIGEGTLFDRAHTENGVHMAEHQNLLAALAETALQKIAVGSFVGDDLTANGLKFLFELFALEIQAFLIAARRINIDIVLQTLQIIVQSRYGFACSTHRFAHSQTCPRDCGK